MTVAFVERKLFGGTCVNTGCMPTKTLVASAYAAHLARRAAGLRRRTRRRRPRIDMRTREGARRCGRRPTRATASSVAARARTAARSSPARRGSNRRRRSASARDVLTAPRIFINVGGRARVPDLPGIKSVPFLTNTTILAAGCACRVISSSSAAATSDSSSRRSIGASAPRSPSSRCRRV